MIMRNSFPEGGPIRHVKEDDITKPFENRFKKKTELIYLNY